MKFVSLTFATLLSISLYTTSTYAAAAKNDVDGVTHITIEALHKKDGTVEFKQSAKHFGNKKEEADTVSLGIFSTVKELAGKAVDKAKDVAGKALDVAKSAGGAVLDAGKQVAGAALGATVGYVTNPDNIAKIAKNGLEAGAAFATGGTQGLTDHMISKASGSSKKTATSNDNDE